VVSDFVNVRGLRVKSRIGVTGDERAEPQYLVIDLSVEMSAEAAASSDDLAQTVDYDALVTDVEAWASSGEWRLLERLAADICDLILRVNNVRGVTVEVAKENPPVRQDVARISVRMERRK
jgi:FolB domain-containing protein